MSKNVLVLGVNGYIGNAVTQRLLERGYNVKGVDNGLREKCVQELNSFSALPNLSMMEQEYEFRNKYSNYVGTAGIDIATQTGKLESAIVDFRPDTILNLAHIPSGPYSMIDRVHANTTLYNNIISTNNLLWYIKEHCPECHYITIGTTGEYDHYSNIDIEEGYISFEHNGRQSEKMIYPRRPGSIYHASKVSSTYLIDYLTRTWGLKTTDIMQSVVFGSYTDEINESGIYSRLDTDEAFGTAINRFMLQSILDQPLTVYGKGEHQRGFLALNDSVQALMIAIENEPEIGETRVWNQLSFWESMNSLAQKVSNTKQELTGTPAKIDHIPTLRNEKTTDHYYHYKTDILKSLGYEPTRTLEQELKYTMELLLSRKDRLKYLEKNAIPKISFT